MYGDFSRLLSLARKVDFGFPIDCMLVLSIQSAQPSSGGTGTTEDGLWTVYATCGLHMQPVRMHAAELCVQGSAYATLQAPIVYPGPGMISGCWDQNRVDGAYSSVDGVQITLWTEYIQNNTIAPPKATCHLFCRQHTIISAHLIEQFPTYK